MERKQALVISSESLSDTDNKSISYLTMIGALSDLGDDIMSDINVTDSSNSASSDDDL